MKIGYARVSTDEQNLRMQVMALREAGCERIFEDQGVSGAAVIKPQYEAALDHARAGDELVVWKLDRLARKVTFLIDAIERIEREGLSFRSLSEKIETASVGGRLFFHVMAALAEFERETIVERTTAGIAAARKAGKHVGRPPTITPERWKTVRKLLVADPPTPVTEIAKMLGVARVTVYDHIRKDPMLAAYRDSRRKG